MRNLILTLIIWIICFTAITVGLSLTYTWYKNRGQNICIHFTNVEGLIPNQSKIIYLGVQIGSVIDIYLDLSTNLPVVKARISKRMLPLLGEHSEFWIVRPELGLGSVRNLGTIASGNYIGVNPIAGKFKQIFTAIDTPPLEDKFDDGLHITLKANSAAGLEIGSAILYHDFKIGEIGDMDLSADKRSVLIKIFIEQKYASVIRKNSYFGNVSGFHASINLFSGSEISMKSFNSLINGSIAVVTPDLKSPMVKNDYIFNLLSHTELAKIKEAS